jgi:SAM-dependent methyltransferase/DNA-binding transcriptional ArsR family regulator
MRAIRALQEAGRELCVCEIAEALKETQYNTSRHMRILKDAGLVKERKDGRWVFYSLAEPEDEFTKHILEAISNTKDENMAEDSRRLKEQPVNSSRCATDEEGCCDMRETEAADTKEAVRKSYGALASNDSPCCPTDSCCSGSGAEETGYTRDDVESVPEEVITGLGCGNPLVLADIDGGDTVLDLGSGSGFDCFLAAKKAERVIGIDMTEEMVNRSREIAERHGYKNVEFLLGEIENLPIEDNTIDVVISNCVINLSPDKRKVFSEAYRVLKPGGIMVISDTVLEKELPEVLKRDPEAWCGCIAGAMRREEYLKAIRDSGFEITYARSQAFNEFVDSITVKAKKV